MDSRLPLPPQSGTWSRVFPSHAASEELDDVCIYVKNFVGTIKIEAMSIDSDSTAVGPQEPANLKSLSLSIGRDGLTLVSPESPVVVSPSHITSSPSTPGDGESSDIFDEPETPIRQRGKRGRYDTSTPLTPPTPLTPLTNFDHLKAPVFTPINKPQANFLTPSAASTSPTIWDLLRTPSPSQNQLDLQCSADTSDQKLSDEADNAPVETGTRPKTLLEPMFKLPLGTVESEKIAKVNAELAALRPRYSMTPLCDFKGASDPVKAIDPDKSPTPTKTRPALSKDTTTRIKSETSVDDLPKVSCQRRTSAEVFRYKTLELIIPFDFHSRLKRTALCVATKVTSVESAKSTPERCSYTAKTSAIKVDKIIKSMVECNREPGYSNLLDHVTNLVKEVTCGRHQESALGSVKHGSRMDKLREKTLIMSKEEQVEFDLWIDTITKQVLPSNTHGDTEGSAIDKKPVLDRRNAGNLVLASSPITKSSEKSDNAPAKQQSLTFRPYLPNTTKNLSVSEALRNHIIKPITRTDGDYGFIYLFWDNETLGMGKIGRTINLQQRLKAWNSKCRRDHSYHQATHNNALCEIPHFSRIERLIHLELKDHRKEAQCGCGTTHREWFAVTEAHVVKVFTKWKDWIMQMPYTFDEEAKNWKIRSDMMHTLDEVCKPVLEEKVKHVPRLQRPALKTSPRRRSGVVTRFQWRSGEKH